MHTPAPTWRRFLPEIGILLALLALGWIGYRYSPLLLPPIDVSLSPAQGCDLQKAPCSSALPDGGSIELDVLPRPIPTMKEIQVRVRVIGVEPDKVEVDFAGASMNMGFNRVRLSGGGQEAYSGVASLPVCVTGRMEWVATVLVESGRKRIAAPFRFEAGPH